MPSTTITPVSNAVLVENGRDLSKTQTGPQRHHQALICRDITATHSQIVVVLNWYRIWTGLQSRSVVKARHLFFLAADEIQIQNGIDYVGDITWSGGSCCSS